MPTEIEILWKGRLVGTVHSPWEPCQAVTVADDNDLGAFAHSSGEFLAQPGIEAGRQWYRGLLVDGCWVDGADLHIGEVDVV